MAQIIDENDAKIKSLLKEYFRFIEDKEINRIDEDKMKKKSMKFKKGKKDEKEATVKENPPRDHVNMVIQEYINMKFIDDALGLADNPQDCGMDATQFLNGYQKTFKA